MPTAGSPSAELGALRAAIAGTVVTPDDPRLHQVKARYDPDRTFRFHRSL
jgi:FAD/FMN-containing dehydrogenase